MNLNSLTIVKTKRSEVLILLFCLLIGFAFRFYTFDRKSLWLDEIYTLNDSRDSFSGQIKFYKENPAYHHPPLFFILTHQFYPFSRPERDLRIIPLIFGTLSIFMIFLLAKQFSSSIALHCALSLVFMTYHISLSQDARSYSFLMFIGTVSLYLLIKHLKTLKLGYLILTAFCYAILFYTSYSSVLFIIFSQLFWFYQFDHESKKPSLRSIIILLSLTFLICFPWILFIALNYMGQTVNIQPETTGSFPHILYGVFYDWAPHVPLLVTSIVLFIVFVYYAERKKNAFILLASVFLPILSLFLICRVLKITHFVSSRYFINFFPLFLLTLYLSLDAIENRLKLSNKLLNLRLIFLFLFIASHLVALPLYYRSQKQDFRGLAAFLRENLKSGDHIFVSCPEFFPGILHYLGILPDGRHYLMLSQKDPMGNDEIVRPFIYRRNYYIMHSSKVCCTQHISKENRLWVITMKGDAKEIHRTYPFLLKGYFDGSFLFSSRFPSDGSLYLFLYDPTSPTGKEIDISALQ